MRSGQDAGEGTSELINHPGRGLLQLSVSTTEDTRGGDGEVGYPMINLSSLNSYVTTTKFKMATISLVLEVITRKGTIRSQSTSKTPTFKYSTVPVHQYSQPHPWIVSGAKVYQFNALLFVLSTATKFFISVRSGI